MGDPAEPGQAHSQPVPGQHLQMPGIIAQPQPFPLYAGPLPGVAAQPPSRPGGRGYDSEEDDDDEVERFLKKQVLDICNGAGLPCVRVRARVGREAAPTAPLCVLPPPARRPDPAPGFLLLDCCAAVANKLGLVYVAPVLISMLASWIGCVWDGAAGRAVRAVAGVVRVVLPAVPRPSRLRPSGCACGRAPSQPPMAGAC